MSTEWSLAKYIDETVKPSVVACIGEEGWGPWKVALRSAILRDRSQGKGKLSLALRNNPEGGIVALAKCAQLGLSPDPQLDHFALVPFGSEIQGMVMYRGWMHLALSSGHVEWVHADVIYKQEYDANLPIRDLDTNRVLHNPRVFERDGFKDDDIIGAYAMAKVKGASRLESIILTRGEINKRRAKSKASNSPAWTEWFPKMCVSKAYQSLFRTGRVPLSPSARAAATADEEDEVFVQAEAEVVEEPRKVTTDQPPPPVISGADQHIFDALDKDPFPADADQRNTIVEAIMIEAVDRELSDEVLATVASEALGREISRIDDSLTVKELEAILEAIRPPRDESGDAEQY